MALTPTVTTKVNTDKQIVIPASATAGTIIYTVPAGRKFIGRVDSGLVGSSFSINGVSMAASYSAGYSTIIASTNSYPNALTLVAGTTVAFLAASQGVLIGVEYDA